MDCARSTNGSYKKSIQNFLSQNVNGRHHSKHLGVEGKTI